MTNVEKLMQDLGIAMDNVEISAETLETIEVETVRQY